MKCDELKAKRHIDEDTGIVFSFYGKSEVDAAIAELKCEINHKDGVCKRWFARCMESRTENIKLKRALWLSRAENAKTAKNLFDILWRLAGKEKVGVTGCAHKMSTAKTLKEPKFFFVKFVNVERKCLAKAEEYR